MAKQKHAGAVELGRLGGLAKSAKMTPEQRQAAAAAMRSHRTGTNNRGWPKGVPRGKRVVA